MHQILRSQLPATEAEVRAAHAEYRAALEAHKGTVGAPAPWPAFEILRALPEQFEVIDDPSPPAADLSPSEQYVRAKAAIEHQRDIDLGPGGPGAAVGQHEFHLDDRFLTELLGMILGLQLGVLSGPQTVRTKRNESVALGLDDLKAVAAAVGARRRTIHEAAWTAKDELGPAPEATP